MTDLRLDWYQRVVTRLNTANSEKALKSSIRATLPELVQLLGFDGGMIRIETASDKARDFLEIGSGEVQLCFPAFSPPGCVCGRALASDEGVVISSEISEPHCSKAGYRSALCGSIPIGAAGSGLFFAASGKRPTPDSEALSLSNHVLALIGQAAARISENRLVKMRAADLETVNTVGRLITSQLALKDMVREIVARLGGVLETDEVNVVVYDERKRELLFLASYFADGSDLDRPEAYPLSDGMNSWIIKNRRSLVMKQDTVKECERLGIRHGGRPAKSWLGAPMIYKDRVVGVVSVQSYSKTGLYGRTSVELLEAVARQCAVAVENARLFEEVVEREKEKELLYFSLTHDLLSLLSPVSGYARLLQTMPRERGDDGFDNAIKNIVNAADRISRFVEGILTHAKIKSGKLVLNIERSDIMKAVETAALTHSPELAMRGIALYVNGAAMSLDHVEAPWPIEADFDRAQIERVFLNLVSNAVKHARSRIDIEVEADDENVICRVSDDGQGVAEEQRKALFDEFYQAGARKRGVGLGLPTVKKIVELHEGSVRVDTAPGRGFAMEFSWPRFLSVKNKTGGPDRAIPAHERKDVGR